jgi:hypothetical protein
MAWHDGELFPVGKEWDSAPVGAMLVTGECTHDHTVTLKQNGEPTMTRGRTVLYCLDCMNSWWEDTAKIAGSPWAGK